MYGHVNSCIFPSVLVVLHTKGKSQSLSMISK